MSRFENVIAAEEDLRALYRQPSALVQSKVRSVMDAESAAFVGVSPFVLVATAGPEGRCDVSPRGGPAGFVKVLDETTLAVPDLNGNNLLDTMRNVVATGRVGLLFVVPGQDETLRVNGRACVTADPAVLERFAGELRRPKVAIGVEVDEVFVHCAKAFRRGGVWDPKSWPATGSGPDAVRILRCQLGVEAPEDEMRAAFERGYAADLAADRPD